MPFYHITQYEVIEKAYEIEADGEAEALEKFQNCSDPESLLVYSEEVGIDAVMTGDLGPRVELAAK